MNLFTSHNGNNSTRFKDDHYDRLVAAASAEQNPVRRRKIYEEADRYLCREKVPCVPVFVSTQNVMVKPWVKGMDFNRLDIQFFHEVSIEPPAARSKQMVSSVVGPVAGEEGEK